VTLGRGGGGGKVLSYWYFRYGENIFEYCYSAMGSESKEKLQTDCEKKTGKGVGVNRVGADEGLTATLSGRGVCLEWGGFIRVWIFERI